MRGALLGPVLAETGWFNRPFIASAIDQHLSGRRDYGATIWALLMFEAFLRDVHQGAPSVAEPTAALS
jgi:asparagine synthase (glutamine-hydrolysing)